MSVICRHRRRRGRSAAMVSIVTLALTLAAVPGLSAQSARDIVDQVDRLLRGESSRSRVTMEIETEHWSRSLGLEVWSLGVDHAIVRVLEPLREAGTATLMAEEEVWNYLPRVDRTIKVPPSLMMGSWMGSHFTHDDLVKESRMIEDYDIEIGFEGDRDGVTVWEFELTPKPEAPVVWGRVVQQVRKEDMMPTWARYYDEDGGLVRTIRFDELEVHDGRLIPTTLTLRPTDKPSESTTVIYHEIDFDIDIDVDYFSLRNLRARR